MERMPIYQQLIFNKYSHAGPLFYAVLVRLSPGYPPLIGRLHTRYSPVRRSPPMYCYTVLPLDLHVLSLSLAFILSQDQTLRCINCFVLLRIRFLFQVLTVLIFNTCTTCWYVNLSKNFRFLFDCGCKGKDFFLTTKFFRRKFEKFFFQSLWRLDCCLASLTSSPFLRLPLSSCIMRRSLSNAGAKVEELLLHSKLFTNYFLFIFSR